MQELLYHWKAAVLYRHDMSVFFKLVSHLKREEMLYKLHYGRGSAVRDKAHPNQSVATNSKSVRLRCS